jgi:hypothetical protein
MPIERSKVSTQGEISNPVHVPRGKFTFEDIHRAIFKGRVPKKHTVADMKKGIAQYIRDKHAPH